MQMVGRWQRRVSFCFLNKRQPLHFFAGGKMLFSRQVLNAPSCKSGRCWNTSFYTFAVLRAFFFSDWGLPLPTVLLRKVAILDAFHADVITSNWMCRVQCPCNTVHQFGIQWTGFAWSQFSRLAVYNRIITNPDSPWRVRPATSEVRFCLSRWKSPFDLSVLCLFAAWHRSSTST